MAEQPQKQWVIVKFFHHAIERTLAEVEELKAGGLFVRDASGPGDTQQQAAADPEPLPETVPRPVAQPAAPRPADKPAA